MGDLNKVISRIYFKSDSWFSYLEQKFRVGMTPCRLENRCPAAKWIPRDIGIIRFTFKRKQSEEIKVVSEKGARGDFHEENQSIQLGIAGYEISRISGHLLFFLIPSLVKIVPRKIYFTWIL